MKKDQRQKVFLELMKRFGPASNKGKGKGKEVVKGEEEEDEGEGGVGVDVEELEAEFEGMELGEGVCQTWNQ